MKRKINPRFTVLLSIIIIAGCTRFFSIAGHSPLINFTPIGAMALFGGSYFSQKWKAFLLPLLTLFISDIIIQNLFYHGQFGVMYDGWLFVYGSFALMVLIGKSVFKRVNIKSILLGGVSASLIHWSISNFGFWFVGGLDVTTGLPYTFDMNGLMKSYTLALTYMKDFLAGTVFYSAIMFGLFELAQKRFPVLSLRQA